jgi:UDP:flavonoid glycosyltransferase YjiC (YdhE family)
MISYPFFWDQPALARRCQRLGLAIPLSGAPRGAFDEGDVRAAVARAIDERESMRAALAQAREWERAVIDNRPAVLARIAALAG